MGYPRIEVPTLERQPLPWSLLTVADDVTPEGQRTGDSARWEGGLAWESDRSVQVRSWDQTAETPGDKDLSVNTEVNGSWDPVVIYLTYQCATFDDTDEARVRRRLEAGAHQAAETHFWTWAISAATAVATGTATEVVAEMGQALSDTDLGTQGLFHMPARSAEVYLGSNGFDPGEGKQPRTAGRGDKIAVGAGYTNEGNPVGTSQWIVASGPVGVLRSEIRVIKSNEFVTEKNEFVYLAEQVIGFQVDDAPLVKGLIQF